MKLVICPSLTFAKYLLAYISEFGKNREFHIIVQGNPQIPYRMEKVATALNTVFTTEKNAVNYTFNELIIHNFAKFDKHIDYIAQFKFKKMTYYADGLTNTFYGLPSIDPRLDKLIYFGFELRQSSFETAIPKSLSNLERVIVSFEQLGKISRASEENLENPTDEIFGSGDLLLVMRYWGKPGSQYEFRKKFSMIDYLEKELSKHNSVKRIIYRSDSRFDHQLEKNNLQKIYDRDLEVLSWDEFLGSINIKNKNYDPESLIFETESGPSFFFGFDTSLNILVSNNWPNTQVLWPSSTIYNKYFDLPRSSGIVDEHISFMQSFQKQNLKSAKFEIETEGVYINQAITRMILEQGRFTQTQERDALTQERDALTQERDALVNSRIWKWTRPLRIVKNFFES